MKPWYQTLSSSPMLQLHSTHASHPHRVLQGYRYSPHPQPPAKSACTRCFVACLRFPDLEIFQKVASYTKIESFIFALDILVHEETNFKVRQTCQPKNLTPSPVNFRLMFFWFPYITPDLLPLVSRFQSPGYLLPPRALLHLVILKSQDVCRSIPR